MDGLTVFNVLSGSFDDLFSVGLKVPWDGSNRLRELEFEQRQVR